jgi:uncharacterized protein (UPF0332 family)
VTIRLSFEDIEIWNGMDRAEREQRWQGAKTKRAAAQLCFTQDFFSESVTLSDYACYQAMWIVLDDPPAGLWRHGGLINEFCRGRWQTFPTAPQALASVRKKLDRLYVYRVQSDYEARSLNQSQAQEALDIADEVLRLVAQHTSLMLQ